MPKKLLVDETPYQVLFDNTPDSMFVIDKSGKILAMNKQGEKAIGYPVKDLLKRHISFIVKENYRAAFNALLRKCFNGTIPTTAIEVLNKQGNPMPMDLDLISIRGNGRDAFALAHLRDAAEKSALLQRLVQSEKMKVLGEMASGIAHNINNILTIVLGHIKLLQLRPEDKQVLQDAINIISKSAWDGAQFIRKLQAFSKINRHKEKFVPVDVNYIIRESVEFTKPRWKDEAQFYNIRYNIRYNNLTDIILVSGNPSELREVFVNIINNALDAMPEGGELSFSTKMNGCGVLISIADTGVGIPEELCKKVFEPFFTTKYGRGTGLGLSTAYTIITEHKGSINVKSIIGKGSEFTVKLPVISKAAIEAGAYYNTPLPSSVRAATVLVIDDEKEICNIVAKALESAGHNVFTAQSGKGGIALFKKRPFNLVLIDLTMPDMSGWEAARIIHTLESKKRYKTPMAIFTGWGDTLEPSKLVKFGVNMVISKPLDNNQLLNIVKQTVQNENQKSKTKNQNDIPKPKN